MRTSKIVLITAFVVVGVFPSAPRADRVTFVAEFADVTDAGSTILRLWRHGDEYVGTLTYALESQTAPHFGILRYFEHDEATGSVSFAVKLSLGGADAAGAVDVLEFHGTMSRDAISGVLGYPTSWAGRRNVEPITVNLRRRTPAGPGAADYATYPSWRTAQEPQIRGYYQDPPEQILEEGAGSRYSFTMDGGTSVARGEGHELWNTGGSVGLGLFYSLNRYVKIGARVAYNRWGLNHENAVREAIPPGVGVQSADAAGTATIYEFAPVVRLTSGDNSRRRVEMFVQGGAGLYYLDFNTSVYVAFTGPKGDVAVFDVGDKAARFGAHAGPGADIRLSSSTHLDVFPAYHFVFEGSETTEFFVFNLQYRMDLNW